MLNIYTVSFFGHRYIENYSMAEKKLEKIIRELLEHKEYVDFLVGRNGEFDQIVASTVHRVKKAVDRENSSLILVLPYLTSEFINNRESFESYYDDIEVSAGAETKHFKAAIQVRNREMVDRSDLVIYFVQRKSGGAYQTIQYASRQGKECISLIHYQ